VLKQQQQQQQQQTTSEQTKLKTAIKQIAKLINKIA